MIVGSPGGQLPSAYRDYTINFHNQRSSPHDTALTAEIYAPNETGNTGHDTDGLNFSSEVLFRNFTNDGYRYNNLLDTSGAVHNFSDIGHTGRVVEECVNRDNTKSPSPSRGAPHPLPVISPEALYIHSINSDTMGKSSMSPPSCADTLNENESAYLNSSKLKAGNGVSTVEKAILGLLRKSSHDNAVKDREAISNYSAVTNPERSIEVSTETKNTHYSNQIPIRNDLICKDAANMNGMYDTALNDRLSAYPAGLVPMPDPMEITFLTSRIELLEMRLEHELTTGRQMAIEELISSYEAKILEIKDDCSRRVLYYVNRLRELEETPPKLKIRVNERKFHVGAQKTTSEQDNYNHANVIDMPTQENKDKVQVNSLNMAEESKPIEDPKKELYDQHITENGKETHHQINPEQFMKYPNNISNYKVPTRSLASLADEESMMYDTSPLVRSALPSYADKSQSHIPESPLSMSDAPRFGSPTQQSGSNKSSHNQMEPHLMMIEKSEEEHENNETCHDMKGVNFKAIEEENIKLKNMIVRLVEKIKSISSKQQQQKLDEEAAAAHQVYIARLKETKEKLNQNEIICAEQRGTIEILLTKNTELRDNTEKLSKSLQEATTKSRDLWKEAQSSRALAMQREMDNTKYLAEIEDLKKQLSLISHDAERAKINRITKVYTEQCNLLTEELNNLRRQNSELLVKSIAASPDGCNKTPNNWDNENIAPYTTDVDNNNIQNTWKNPPFSVTPSNIAKKPRSKSLGLPSSPNVRKSQGKLYDIDVSPKIGEGPTAVGHRKSSFSLPS